MSVKVMSWVWEHSRAVGNDRLVLLAIADRCNDDGTEAWPSQETLCHKTRLSWRTVQRSIVALQELGELIVEAERGRVNRYTVNMSGRPASANVRQSDATSAQVRQSDAGVNLTQPPAQVRQSDARQFDTSANSDAGGASLLAHNTSIRPVHTHTARAREAAPAGARMPLVARGEALAWDASQAKAHRSCHPEVCRWRSSAVRVCMPAVLVDEFASKLLNLPHDRAVEDVIAWARQDNPPAGYVVPGDTFAHWRARWTETRASTLPKAPAAGKGPSSTRVVPDAEATDRLLAELTGGRV